jgi:hypothetical protein
VDVSVAGIETLPVVNGEFFAVRVLIPRPGWFIFPNKKCIPSGFKNVVVWGVLVYPMGAKDAKG